MRTRALVALRRLIRTTEFLTPSPSKRADFSVDRLCRIDLLQSVLGIELASPNMTDASKTVTPLKILTIAVVSPVRPTEIAA